LGRLKWPYLENHLSVRAKILHGILKKMFLDLMEKIPSKRFRKLDFNFTPQKRQKILLFGPLKTAIT
jgi:hypothetical protein